MRDFVVFMAMMLSLMLLFTLDRVMAALYSDGVWLRAYVAISVSALIALAFILGVRDVRRAYAREPRPTPPSPPSRWESLSAAIWPLLSVYFLADWWIVVQKPHVALVLKAAYTLLALVYCTTALATAWYVWRRRKNERLAREADASPFSPKSEG